MVAVGVAVMGVIVAAFRGITARQDATEKDVAKLQQAQTDDRGRQERIEKKVDDMADTLHGIDNKLGVMVAQCAVAAHERKHEE